MSRSPKNSSDPQIDPIESEFLAAISRIQSGTPSNKELLADKMAGKLRLSVSSVAKEAGRSRTLIGHKGCRYPKIRDIIQGANSEPTSPTSLRDALEKSRAEVADLKKKLALSQSHNASLLAKIIELEEAVLTFPSPAQPTRRKHV